MSSTFSSPTYVQTSPAPISYPSPRGSDQDSASQSASLSPRVPSPKPTAEGAAVESYTFQPAPQRSATTRSAAVISYTFQPTAERTTVGIPIAQLPPTPVYRIPRSAPAPPIVSQPTPNTRHQIPAVASGRVTRPTFRCFHCRVTCNSRAAFEDHLRGRKHSIARLRRIGLPQCEDCNQVFESESHYFRHLRGKRHLAKTIANNQ